MWIAGYLNGTNARGSPDFDFQVSPLCAMRATANDEELENSLFPPLQRGLPRFSLESGHGRFRERKTAVGFPKFGIYIIKITVLICGGDGV